MLQRGWAGEVRNVSLLVAIGVDQNGYRCIPGVQEGHKDDKWGCSALLSQLKARGLKGVRLIISDACMGLVESATEYYPEADWQRCTVHHYRNVCSHIPRNKMRQVSAMLKAIHAQESRDAALDKANEAFDDLQIHEAWKGRGARRTEDRRDVDLLRPSAGSPDKSPNQRSDGTNHARDPAPCSSRWRVSGW